MRGFIVIVAIVAGGSVHGAEFTVENKCPPTFTVVNKVPAPVPTVLADGGYGNLPSYDAPAGYEWKRYQGAPWKLFPLNAITSAPEVAPTSPKAQWEAAVVQPPEIAVLPFASPGVGLAAPRVAPLVSSNCGTLG